MAFLYCSSLFTGLKKLFFSIFEIKKRPLADALLLLIGLFIYTVAFFPFCSTTGRVYEETMCYFLILQFYATGCFLHFFTDRRRLWVTGGSLAAALAVTARPTALIYYVV